MNGPCPDTVTVLSVEKRRSVVQLVLSDESERCVPAAVFLSLRLKEGQTVSRSGLDARIRALTRNAAGNKAAALLSFRGRSVRETENALRRGGFDDESVEETLASFQELGYLDDEAYAKSFASDAARKGKGKLRIARELAQKGADSATAKAAIEAAAEEEDLLSERERAMEAAQKMLRGSQDIDEKTLARIGRRLSSLGYEPSVIWDVLGKLKS